MYNDVVRRDGVRGREREREREVKRWDDQGHKVTYCVITMIRKRG